MLGGFDAVAAVAEEPHLEVTLMQQNCRKKRCSVDEACVDKAGVGEQPERQEVEHLPAAVAAEPYSLLELIAGQCSGSGRAAVEEAAGLAQRAVVAVDIAAERQG